MEIKQRVMTKYGPGQVAGFERITSAALPVQHPAEYAPGDRVAVALDCPERWPCYFPDSGPPYFSAAELRMR